jgi:hypothetical protein
MRNYYGCWNEKDVEAVDVAYAAILLYRLDKITTNLVMIDPSQEFETNASQTLIRYC